MKKIKGDFKIILKNNDIDYTEFKYNDPIANRLEYVQNEIKNLSSNNLVQKTWIMLKVRDFKSLIMRLNTKVAQEIRDYYITLEEIMLDYISCVNKCNIIQKNNEISKLQNSLDFIINQNNELLLENKKFREKYDNDTRELNDKLDCLKSEKSILKKNNKKINKKLDRLEEDLSKKSETIEKKQNRIIELVTQLRDKIIKSNDPNKEPMILILYFEESETFKIVRGQKKRVETIKKKYRDNSIVFYMAYEPNPITFFDKLRSDLIEEEKLIFSGTNDFKLAEDYSQEDFLEDLDILGLERIN